MPGDPGEARGETGGGQHAGRDIRVENQGSGAAVGQAHIVNNYQLTQAPVPLPHRIGRVPVLAVPFQEREFPALAAAGPVGGPPIVLAGVVGTGKTQLAAKFAESAWTRGDLDLLLWVEASTRESIRAGYAKAAQDLLGRTYSDAADGAQAFFNWLRPAGGTRPHPWLIVLDGVTDPADVADDLWPPASPVGRVLITSHRRDYDGLRDPVVVPVRGFTYDEVRGYLRRALDLRVPGAAEDDGIARRVQAAGGASAFLDAAAREVVHDGLALDTYLDRLDRLDGIRNPPVSATPLGRSVEAAQHRAPEGVALPVLQLVAVLGAKGVPELFLFTEPAVKALTHLRQTALPSAPEVTEQDVRAALLVLRSMSLLDREQWGTYRTVRASEPVCRVALAQVDELLQGWLLRRAAEVLSEMWPETEPGLYEARLLRAMAGALTYTAFGGLLSRRSIPPVAFRAGRSAGAWGRPRAAEQHFRDLVSLRADQVGAFHPDILRARSRAARWSGARGNDLGAAAELAEVLADQEAVLGADHPDVLTTRHCLAQCRLSATGWDAAGPRSELAAVLRDRIRVLGPDHADCLVTTAAIVRAMLNRPGEAATGDDVTAAAERLLGEEAAAAGDFDATRMATALHAELERIGGRDHPVTLNARRNLAGLRSLGGDDGTALDMMGAVLDDATRALGREHPVTLACRVSAALVDYNRGETATAAYALATLHEDQAHLFGNDHPDTLEVREHLFTLAREAGPADTGELLMAEGTELLTDVQRVFGADHRRSRHLQIDLAQFQAQTDRLVPAIVALSDVVTRCTRILGADHPETLRARQDLWQRRGQAGDVIGAVAGLAAILADQTRVLGAEHIDTLVTRHNLAWYRGEAGDVSGAVAELMQVLEIRERTLGPDNPHTEDARLALSLWQSKPKP
ncbi:MAG: tetratricopeptide repeat protein [Streptomyces sp.]|nr:tetratricopeptide repeat protein [Streptomyces sp.]